MSDLYSDKERLLRELNDSANKGNNAGRQVSDEDAEALRALYGQAVHMPQGVGNIDEPIEVDKLSTHGAKTMRSVASKADAKSVSAMQNISRAVIQVFCAVKAAFSPRESPRTACSKNGHQCGNCGEKIPFRDKY